VEGVPPISIEKKRDGVVPGEGKRRNPARKREAHPGKRAPDTKRKRWKQAEDQGGEKACKRDGPARGETTRACAGTGNRIQIRQRPDASAEK